MGLGWYIYLGAHQFPPDIARLVPIVWLAGAVVAGLRAVRALRCSDGRLAAGLALAVSVPSAALAAVFSMGALMGD